MVLRTSRLLLVIAAAFFLTLGRGGLSEPDEARYAEVAREMVRSGDWVTPRIGGVPFFDKPPLAYWVTASSFTIFGRNEFAARITPALSGALCVAVIAWLGTVLYGPATGRLAALILATSPVFFAVSQALTLDLPLTFGTTLSIACFLVALERSPDRRRMLLLAGWAAAGLATLAKGPIGVAIPFAVVGGTLFLQRRWKDLLGLEWLRGGIAFTVIVLPWFILVSGRNPGFLWWFFVREHVLRFTTSMHRRGGPVWYYLPIVVLGTLPWSLVAAFALRSVSRSRLLAEIRDHRFLPFALWTSIPLVLFSLSGSKLPTYVVPIFPPIALQLARLGGRLAAPRAAGVWLAVMATAALVLGGLGLISPPAHPHWIADAHVIAVALVPAIVLAAALAAAVVIAMRRWEAPAALEVLGLGLLAIFLTVAFHRDAVPNERALGLAVREILPRGGRFVSYFHRIYGVSFYARVPSAVVRLPDWWIEESPGIDEDASFWQDDERLIAEWRSGKPLLLAIKPRDLERIRTRLDPRPRAYGLFGRRMLVGNW